MTRDEMLKLGEWMRAKRTDMRKNSRQMAEEIGIQYSRYRAIEAGSEKSVGELTLSKIQDKMGTFNCTLSNVSHHNKGNLNQTVGCAECTHKMSLDAIVDIILRDDFELKKDLLMKEFGLDKKEAIKMTINAFLKTESTS